jgi:NitT/TauT family transport system ATP-binding protein
MIQTNDLTIDYGDNNGIFNINLTIKHGDIYAIVGHSGCGKTTLLHALAGILKADQGTIAIHDHKGNITHPGLIQQKDALFPWFNVSQNIALGLKESKEVINNKINTILMHLDLVGYRNHYPAQLSGGQKQRVSIGRTLVSNPDVLLMDEPTASLDAFTKEALQDLLLKLYTKKKRTTLFVTHSIEEAVFLANKVLIMDKGKIVETFNNPLEHSLDLRDSPDFYAVVKDIRLTMGGL